MPSPSPTNTVTVSMDLFDALRAVRDGHKITALGWGNPKIYGMLQDIRLMILLEDGLLHPWIISEGDMLRTDWVIVPDSASVITTVVSE